MSIEQLAGIQVTSVSKRSEPLGQAASAIYVITRDQILRSGAVTVPEILRLAPNLQVYQTSASRYVITSRGLNGSQAAQNFSNKLLVLIDGRTVYSPLFSGVYWDMQDVLAQDIERIEVVSGPGAALWGANAVNGVINITTRDSADTQGGVVTASVGDQQRSASLRFGGRISEALTYRLYAKTVAEDDTYTAAGARAHDHWSKPQAGFRLDWTPTRADTITLQGDGYKGFEAQAGLPAQDINGGNLLGRWSRAWEDGSAFQLQGYYDHAERGDEASGSGFRVDTYDVDVQHSFSLGERQQIVAGGGYRLSRYRIDGSATLLFSPPGRDLKLFNAFVQDSVTLGPRTTLVLGLKVEDDPYIKPQLLPTARLAWTPGERLTLWGAVSRAIRSPTPFDRDVVEIAFGGPFLVGDSNFRSETLTAYELGAKIKPTPKASLVINSYYNTYDDLRSIELTPVVFLPLRWGNLLKGHAYGVEAWGDYQVAPWWRLSAGFNYLDQKFKFQPGASGLVGLSQVANDPKYQASLKSALDLGDRVTLDAALRYVSALPEPRIPSYVELNGRLAWNVTDQVQLALSGRNLLHAKHTEYEDGAQIPRSVFVDVQWRF
ncbi:TonB-dependent receptor [Phenylobacterium sp. LjRoot225]|uniref:TonB-dependent receptor plug domain-containing protein n=1 Tax=Phenylobacterium sp. LjRoot225 TaxID=3342285 RepID=UPI003ECE96F5